MSALEARLNRIKSILNLDAEKQLVAAVCWVLHCSGCRPDQKRAPTPTAIGARS